MHLHGYSFQVIDMGTRDQLKSGKTAFTNATHAPVIKDAVVIPSGGFIRIRLRTTNPGFWLFHCHFEYGIVIKVGDREEMQTPPTDFPKCGNYLEPFTGHTTTLSSFSFMKLICIAWFLVFLLKKLELEI